MFKGKHGLSTLNSFPLCCGNRKPHFRVNKVGKKPVWTVTACRLYVNIVRSLRNNSSQQSWFPYYKNYTRTFSVGNWPTTRSARLQEIFFRLSYIRSVLFVAPVIIFSTKRWACFCWAGFSKTYSTFNIYVYFRAQYYFQFSRICRRFSAVISSVSRGLISEAFLTWTVFNFVYNRPYETDTTTDNAYKKKLNLYFTIELRRCLDLFSAAIWVTEFAQAYCVMPEFNSKWKYEKYATFAHVVQSTQNLTISRCCFADDG